MTQASTLASSLATKESGTEGKPLLWEVELHCVSFEIMYLKLMMMMTVIAGIESIPGTGTVLSALLVML